MPVILAHAGALAVPRNRETLTLSLKTTLLNDTTTLTPKKRSLNPLDTESRETHQRSGARTARRPRCAFACATATRFAAAAASDLA